MRRREAGRLPEAHRERSGELRQARRRRDDSARDILLESCGSLAAKKPEPKDPSCTGKSGDACQSEADCRSQSCNPGTGTCSCNFDESCDDDWERCDDHVCVVTPEGASFRKCLKL